MNLAPDILARSLLPWLLGRNDPINRWGNLTSSHTALPGLRGFWPMSVVGGSGQAQDLALGNNLANNNNALFSRSNLVPFCAYNGTNMYHSVADAAAHDIIGSEAYIASAAQGLTMGMWIQYATLPGAATKAFSKGTTTGNARAYFIGSTASNQFIFAVSDNGTNAFSASDSAAFVVNQWYFVVGRFDPSTEVKLWVGSSAGLATFTNTTSIPATLNNSATGLAIGAQADGTQFANIRASMCFVCCQMLDDYHVKALFEQGRKLYGL